MLSEKLRRDIYHYHLHVVYVPVVEKKLYFRKNNANPELAGKLKEVIPQIGRSRGGLSTKIHAIVDALGLPVFLTLSEGQEHDAAHAEKLLSQVNIKNSDVLADKGYDSYAIIDYIYEHGGEPTIPSRSNRKIQRRCDWWLYKERHVVENFFLRLKNFRRVATLYDKLDTTFAGFVCIASIMIWLK